MLNIPKHAVVFTLAFALHSFAAPLSSSAPPTVKISNGTVIGSTQGAIDTFYGIPYADPPTGTQRLRPARVLTQPFGTITATAQPKSCPQFASQGLAAPDDPTQSEDCLIVNIQRPSVICQDAKLPVVLWIHGGGFEIGDANSDASMFIQKSIDLGQPFIFVALQYRLGAFGFLAGKEMRDDHATNIGLRDQRLAMEWVQDNIQAFGGDPSKGESAGAASVYDHLIINNGDNSYKNGTLFRAAIMHSGAALPSLEVTHSKPQDVYDTVVRAAGCSTTSDTLDCLRQLPYAQFLEAANSLPNAFGYRALDLAYAPRPDPSTEFFSVSPEEAMVTGKYARVPIITGNQEDEGPFFALYQFDLKNTDDLVDYLLSYFPLATKRDIVQLVATYPNDPRAGAPYNTGTDWILYPQFKRLASIIGDLDFILVRRCYLDEVWSTVPAWSFLGTYLSGSPVLGTTHVADLLEIFGGIPVSQPVDAMRTYYTSFFNHMDPNAISSAATALEWPQYNTTTRPLMNYGAAENTITTDDFRQPSAEQICVDRQRFRI
ncbi:hypothetical protein FH972_025067 [Carpinus fangiana]|uniref:Carboxylesterase type B domain-containing protein n=1 Tax=Carpinus fangiana TaxID=176857 RepID=A0A5N6KZY6_9ROSI|nr:hypothetical protein FH972_025067 [Carpinus fangiana]